MLTIEGSIGRTTKKAMNLRDGLLRPMEDHQRQRHGLATHSWKTGWAKNHNFGLGPEAAW
jgi:hypothetical protein